MSQVRVPNEEMALLMQRVADGQATDADLERWASLLDENPDLMVDLENLQTLSLHVGNALRAEAATIPAVDLERRIMLGLDEPQATSAWARLKAGLREFRWILAPLAAGGLAAVTAVALPRVMTSPEDAATETPAAGQLAAAEVHGLDVNGTAVVFQTSRNVTVIWVNAADPSDAPAEVTEELEGSDDSAAQ